MHERVVLLWPRDFSRSRTFRICASSARNRCCMAVGWISRQSQPRWVMPMSRLCARCCASGWDAASANFGRICFKRCLSHHRSGRGDENAPPMFSWVSCAMKQAQGQAFKLGLRIARPQILKPQRIGPRDPKQRHIAPHFRSHNRERM